MADTVAITAGSGTTVATDDIGGVHYQRVKIGLGADGTAVDAIAGAGVNGTGVQRVTIATDDAVNTALATLNTSVNSTNAQLPSVLGQAASAASLSTVLASDQMGTVSGAATATSRLPVSEPDGAAVSGSVSSAATLFTQDMTGYESISVQVTSAGSACTISYETSDDNSTYYAVPGYASVSNQASTVVTTSNTVNIFRFGKWGKYFRARVSTYGSGTVTVAGTLHKAPYQTLMAVSSSGGFTIVGQAAHDAVISGAPVRAGGRAVTANYTAVASGDVADYITTVEGKQVQVPFSIPETTWQFACAAGGVVNTSDVVVQAAAGAGLRNYVTGLTLHNSHATVATEVVLKDGSTVIWRGYVGAGAATVLSNAPPGITFSPPLRGTAATAVNFACITTGSAVVVSAQGYIAP